MLQTRTSHYHAHGTNLRHALGWWAISCQRYSRCVIAEPAFHSRQRGNITTRKSDGWIKNRRTLYKFWKFLSRGGCNSFSSPRVRKTPPVYRRIEKGRKWMEIRVLLLLCLGKYHRSIECLVSNLPRTILYYSFHVWSKSCPDISSLQLL